MDRGTPKTSAPARQVKLLIFGAIALAVLAGGSLYLARGLLFAGPAASGTAAARTAVSGTAVSGTTGASQQSGAAGCGATSCLGTAADVAMAGPPVVVTVPPGRAHPSATRASTSPSASPGASSPHPTAGAPGTAGMMTAPPSPAGSAAPPAPASSAPAQDGSAATQVLALVNQARSAAGLPALTVTSGLESSSSAHNLKMAAGCGLSHQCPGEAAIGDRETAAGVVWTAAGENIGEGGPVADTASAIAQMAVGLTQSMLDEQPPNDGHRMNILSTSFTHIGIAVYRDSAGTVWLTQDFSN
jgi:uncharacterized protein YkwD